MKNLDKRLDDAWSLLVKKRAGGKCEYCRSRKTLNSHHIYSRANKSVRWIPENGVCLCAKHHALSSVFSAHLTPVEFTQWLYKEKGEDFMFKLKLKANSIGRYSTFEKELILKELNKELSIYED